MATSSSKATPNMAPTAMPSGLPSCASSHATPLLSREDTPATPISASLGLDKHGKYTGNEPGTASRYLDAFTKLTVLTFKLIHMVGFAIHAYILLARLVCVAILMTVPSLEVIYYWWFSENITHSIPYGPLFRQNLDVYTPQKRFEDDKNGFPVAVCFTGGAWLVGYKCWLCRLAQNLCEKHGVMVVLVDYRNVPQATMPQMVEDVSLSLKWVQDNIRAYGGDLNRMVVCGQSAGAHLTMMSLLHTAIRKHNNSSGNDSDYSASSSSAFASSAASTGRHASQASSYQLPKIGELAPVVEQDSGDSDNQLERVVDSSDEESNLKPPKTMKKKHRSFSRFVLPPPAERPCYDLGPDTGFPGTVLLFSGAYDLVGLLPFLHERGLYHSSMKRVSGYNLKGSSPLYVVDRMSPAVGDLLPPIKFFHGTKDKTIPMIQTTRFQEKLASIGVRGTEVTILDGQSHTDPIVEHPMLGVDPMAAEILKVLRPGRHCTVLPPLASKFTVNLIGICMPF